MATDTEGTCPGSGAAVPGGRAGCQALFDEVAARAYADWRFASVHDLAFDTYCMQHPEAYCRSAKSYAAHLTRLCCGIEHRGDPRLYAAIQNWLNGSVAIQKPVILSHRGDVTVADVLPLQTPAEHTKRVQSWAHAVWQAYETQHDIARTWVRAALRARE